MTETALGTPGNQKSDNLSGSIQNTQDAPITQDSGHGATQTQGDEMSKQIITALYGCVLLDNEGNWKPYEPTKEEK